jgi:hypothetical protein
VLKCYKIFCYKCIQAKSFAVVRSEKVFPVTYKPCTDKSFGLVANLSKNVLFGNLASTMFATSSKNLIVQKIYISNDIYCVVT